MEHALAAAPRLQLDAKRIAATSGAIAVHVVVLMMLLMPAKVSTPAADEQVIDVIFDEPKPKIIPVISPPKEDKPRPPQQTPPQQVVPIADPPPVNLDQAPSLVDFVAPDVPDEPATSFDTGPATSMFQQVTTLAAPPPVYPRMALTRGIEGTVTLRIHIDAGGNPIEVSVEHSSGSLLLDQAALKVVKARWRFVPAQKDGQATEAWALVPIEFVLN